MGEKKINAQPDSQSRIEFFAHLIDDLKSLEHMLENGMIEDDVIRIGAEQEFCLVNEHWRPAKNALEVLEEINDSHFTTELARYNLELNLDPLELIGNAFTEMEKQTRMLLAKANNAAKNNGSEIVLTGILPSISKDELEMESMTPVKRYFALNEQLKKARGGDFRLYLLGVDELSLTHGSVMFEACNTSFQMHLQISPQEFSQSYNWAQAIAGPVLAVSVNAPLLLGKELWSETRIALFQQSIDTREVSMTQNEKEARVSFGNNWVTGSIADFYKNEISRFKTLFTKDIEKSSSQELKEEEIPKLNALNLVNGTIYRWNRPCYGVGNGKPHIRIENRYIPSGPTIIDEMANFAFWVGLMKGRPAEYDNIADVMDFRDAKSNFFRAARTGTESIMSWRGKPIGLEELVLNTLLPISRIGLARMNIDKEDIDKYLSIIQQRVSTQTGSQWMVNQYRDLKKELKPDDALLALTAAIHAKQNSSKPVSEWLIYSDFESIISKATNVGHIMTSHLVTASADDLGLLTLEFMRWNNIHHLPVVDYNENLVGLITWRHLKQYWDQVHDSGKPISADQIMVKNVITVTASTPIKEAIRIMKKNEIGCVPVVHDAQLIGIITITDLVHLDHD